MQPGHPVNAARLTRRVPFMKVGFIDPDTSAQLNDCAGASTSGAQTETIERLHPDTLFIERSTQ